VDLRASVDALENWKISSACQELKQDSSAHSLFVGLTTEWKSYKHFYGQW
jgi:hypothetical protein